MLLFKEFQDKAKLVRSLNTTFIVLVPKKEDDEDIRDFRPIIFLNNIYKLIAKVLANRLKNVMGKLVNVA